MVSISQHQWVMFQILNFRKFKFPFFVLFLFSEHLVRVKYLPNEFVGHMFDNFESTRALFSMRADVVNQLLQGFTSELYFNGVFVVSLNRVTPRHQQYVSVRVCKHFSVVQKLDDQR